MIQKRLAVTLAFALVAGAIGYVLVQQRDEIGEMRLQAMSGTVSVQRDGEIKKVDEEISIEPGDVVLTGTHALAKLRLTGGRLAWLSDHTRALIADTKSLAVHAGHALVETEEPTEIGFDGVSVHVREGAFRVDMGAGSARVASYRGTLNLAKPGQPRLVVPELFEAPVSAGRLPRAARPIQLREDQWDQEQIAEILDLDEDLTRRAEGLDGQLGSSRPGLDYFSGLAGKRVGFMRPLMKRPVKDLLIGFTIARTAKAPLKRSVRQTFRLHDAGGRWGVVAAIQGARPNPLLAQLGNLILATGVVGGGGNVANADGQPSFTLASSDGGGGTTGGSGDTSGTTSSTGSTGTQDPSGGTTDPGDEEEPAGDCANTVDCNVKEIERGIPRPGSSPSEDEDSPLLNLP